MSTERSAAAVAVPRSSVEDVEHITEIRGGHRVDRAEEGADRDLVAQVVRELGGPADGPSSAREDAAVWLGTSGDPRALAPLLALVDFVDPAGEDEELHYFSIRYAVVDALGNLGDHRAVDELIRLLDDEDLDIVKAAAGALAQLGAERAIEPLQRVASWGDVDYACAVAAHAVGVIQRRARRKEVGLASWEVGGEGKGILILKKEESESELELWKTEGGKPTIYGGMEILESAEALRFVSAPLLIRPDGRFRLGSVPWAPADPVAIWGRHIHIIDERLRLDCEPPHGNTWDLTEESLNGG